MQLVEIVSSPHDRHEGGQIVASFRISGVIGCEIATDDIRAKTRSAVQRAGHVLYNSRTDRAKVRPASQVGRLVVLPGSSEVKEIRVVPEYILIGGIRSVAAIAICLRIDDITSQSH